MNHRLPLLPILPFQEAITSSLLKNNRALLCAPPGSGKSTLVPQFFLDHIKKPILVLQPRRLAARSLAAYVARTRKEEPGITIGFRVRHESRANPSTRIVYQTYGVFIRQALNDPLLNEFGLVILDEFHERSLEMDLSLAWMTHGSLPFLVMSATLDSSPLLQYLALEMALNIDVPVHPVRVSYQNPEAGESSPRQAMRALKGLLQQGLDGSALVFMPGMQEIRRTLSEAAEICGRHNVPLFGLHGSMPLREQTQVLEAPSKGPCVIVSTNVAETSLTIPGVRAVIDSGYERRAAYDPVRDRNTLYRLPISRSSAIQRCGRAGREAPGRCVRLYTEQTFNALAASLSPEITRLELSDTILKVLGLLEKPFGDFLLNWLTPPDPGRFSHGMAVLKGLGAVSETLSLTKKGRALLRWPLDPVSSALLEEASARKVAGIMCAILALWESEQPSEALDLYEEAVDFLSNPGDRRFSFETQNTFEELSRIAPASSSSHSREALAACFLHLLKGRLGVREAGGNRYLFEDSPPATLAGKKKLSKPPEALIALDILETAGAFQTRNNAITAYISVETEWIARELKDQCETRVVFGWDSKRKSVTAEQSLFFRSLPLSRAPLPPEKIDPKGAAEVMAEKCLSGEISLKDDCVKQLLNRIALVARCFPEKNIKALDDDDWKLVYGELCLGKRNAGELDSSMLATEIISYYGHSFGALLDKLAPERMILPSGKKAKVFYPDNGPPEISARITDFIGMKGRFTLCQGRAQGIYDILAPNYRTVQKTEDLGSFWTNVYPEIKPSLKRKYPRHPWP